MRHTTHLATLLLPALLLGCSGSSEPQATPDEAAPTEVATTVEADGPVVARVDGVVVTAKEFEMAAAREAPRDGTELSLEERQAVLDDLITEKMLYLQARQKGIDRDPKVQKVMINTLLRQDVYSKVRNSDFTEEELRAYFDEHREDFVVPEKVQVRRIYIKGEPKRTLAEAEALASDLHAKVQAAAEVQAAPDSFRELASEHSEDPYRRRGGDLGYLSREGKPGISSEVIDKAFELDVGEIAGPFEAGGGYNVIMVAGRRDRVERTFEQMKGSVLRKVKNDRYKELYAEYVDEIDDAYQVEIDDEKLAEIEVTPSRRLSLGPRGLRRDRRGDEGGE